MWLWNNIESVNESSSKHHESWGRRKKEEDVICVCMCISAWFAIILRCYADCMKNLISDTAFQELMRNTESVHWEKRKLFISPAAVCPSSTVEEVVRSAQSLPCSSHPRCNPNEMRLWPEWTKTVKYTIWKTFNPNKTAYTFKYLVFSMSGGMNGMSFAENCCSGCESGLCPE